jgi:hypothetical protein
MNRTIRKRRTITLMVIVFVPGFILLLAIFIFPQIFLSINEKADANLLVVEGWLPPYAIEMTNNEYHKQPYDYIITTGLRLPESDYYTVGMNGYLIFYPHFKSNVNNYNKHHLIEVMAHSKMGGKYCAHFNLFVNDSLVADFNADKKKRKYGIKWEGSLKDIDSIMVQFDNDMEDDWGDRDLYIKDIVIDNEIIIPYQFNSEYDIGLLDGKNRIINNFDSNAEKARNELIASGLDPSYIIAVPGKRTRINRTLTSALAFREWLVTSGCVVKGINIVSVGIHSRRTLMTYRKVLGKSFNIGIISLPEYKNRISKRPGFFEILYEITGIIYYYIILIPY